MSGDGASEWCLAPRIAHEQPASNYTILLETFGRLVASSSLQKKLPIAFDLLLWKSKSHYLPSIYYTPLFNIEIYLVMATWW